MWLVLRIPAYRRITRKLLLSKLSSHKANGLYVRQKMCLDLRTLIIFSLLAIFLSLITSLLISKRLVVCFGYLIYKYIIILRLCVFINLHHSITFYLITVVQLASIPHQSSNCTEFSMQYFDFIDRGANIFHSNP